MKMAGFVLSLSLSLGSSQLQPTSLDCFCVPRGNVERLKIQNVLSNHTLQLATCCSNHRLMAMQTLQLTSFILIIWNG
jgi:hypothetical protein